jgi:DNA-binding NarL/FixJ family response regulator
MAVRLLIVDDHERVRAGVRLLLSRHIEWEICGEAENGRDAIAKVLELSPEVVILDAVMPVMNGFETAERIRQVAPSTKIVFLSLYEIPPAAQLSADGFVSKSTATEDLASTITRVLHPDAKRKGAATA